MSLKKSMFLSVLQNIITLLISFGAGIYIYRHVTPKEVGTFTVSMALLSTFGALRDFGMGTYVLSTQALDVDDLKHAYGWTLLINGSFTAVLFAGAPYIALAYTEPGMIFVVRCLAVSNLIAAFAFPANIVATRKMLFGRLALIGIAGVSVQAVCNVVLIDKGFGAVALAYGQLALAIVTVLCFTAVDFSQMLMIPRLALRRDILTFGSATALTSLVGTASMRLPEIIVGMRFSIGDAATYSRAYQFTSLVRSAFLTALTRPVLAAFTRDAERGSDVGPLYLRIVETVTGVGWPAYTFVAIWGGDLITRIYGHQWTGAAPLVVPFALAQALPLAVAAHYDVFFFKGRANLLLVSESVLFALTTCLLLLPLPSLSVYVYVLVAANCVFVIWYCIAISRLLSLRIIDFLPAWSKSALLVLVTFTATEVVRLFCRNLALPVLLAIGLSAALTGLLLILCGLLCEHLLLKEINVLARRLMAKLQPAR